MFGGLDRPRVLVLGLGESGLAMARWCALHGCTLRLADSRQAPPNLATALALAGGPHAFVGGRTSVSDVSDVPGGSSAPGVPDVPHVPFPPALLDDAIDLVAISPGLSPLDPALAPLLDAARDRRIPVWGELAFFSHALRAREAARVDDAPAAQVIAITGTNGKTTTTALTGQLVARAGRSVAVAGNISPSMLDRLMTAIDANALPQVWVLELSSFQLETAQDFS
ncbi:MAG: Mur ligase family protein, partial [Janthinobacterium lividum]